MKLRAALVHVMAVMAAVAMVAGCATVETEGLSGKVRREYYVSPTGDFKVQVPKLHEGARVSDFTRADRSGVIFEDTYCRQFAVWEEPADLAALSFEEGVYGAALKALQFEGATIIDSEIMDTPLGKAVSIRYRQQGTPCANKSASTEVHQESEILEYIVYKDGIKYTVSYILGDPRNIHQNEFLNNKLDPFFASFEITREPENAQAPGQ